MFWPCAKFSSSGNHSGVFGGFVVCTAVMYVACISSTLLGVNRPMPIVLVAWHLSRLQQTVTSLCFPVASPNQLLSVYNSLRVSMVLHLSVGFNHCFSHFLP